MKKFEDGVEMTRMTTLGATYREKLQTDLELILERTQDFTDSAYTSCDHRENILVLSDRTRDDLERLLRIGIKLVS